MSVSPVWENVGVSESPEADRIAAELFAQFRKDMSDSAAIMEAEGVILEARARQISEAKQRRRWWRRAPRGGDKGT